MTDSPAPRPRDTAQRRAIRAAFAGTPRPLSPLEVLEGAQADLPGLGVATVYRALKMLTEEGWLVTVEIPGEPARYEIAGKPHHHHFHCRACGQVFEVEGCPRNIRTLTPAGFELEDHEIVLYGRCAGCAA